MSDTNSLQSGASTTTTDIDLDLSNIKIKILLIPLGGIGLSSFISYTEIIEKFDKIDLRELTPKESDSINIKLSLFNRHIPYSTWQFRLYSFRIYKRR